MQNWRKFFRPGEKNCRYDERAVSQSNLGSTCCSVPRQNGNISNCDDWSSSGYKENSCPDCNKDGKRGYEEWSYNDIEASGGSNGVRGGKRGTENWS